MSEYSPLTDPKWQAIQREAATASEQIGLGVTSLSHANYAAPALYSQAFFALSTGFERGIKLALTVEHAEENNGDFLSHNTLFRMGHELNGLFDFADELAVRLGIERSNRTLIHNGILEVLTVFATNRTRYYNLDFLGGRSTTANEKEPIAHWYEAVITPILAEHYNEGRRLRDEERATALEALMGSFSLVRHTAEDGSQIGDLYSGSMQTAHTDFAKPYVRLAVLQLARFLASIFNRLTTKSYDLRMEFIPHLSEFFAIYNNPDSYLKSRKCWSTYRP